MKLTDSVAWVTGASKGIGKAIAVAFAQEGADVLVNYHTDEKGALATQAEVEKLGRTALVAKANVAKSDEVTAMADKALEKFGKVDILVNNAAVAWYKPFLEMDEDFIDTVLGINLKGALLCSQHAIKDMITRKYGRIINISSVGGLHAQKFLAVYDASKGGMESLTRELAVEYGHDGITINAISPGPILVERNSEILKTFNEQYSTLVPAGRVGTAEEVARLVVFLASNEAAFINGQVITIDGGLTSQLPEVGFGVPKGKEKYSLE